MKTIQIAINKLKKREDNPRMHPVVQLEELKRSVKKFGQIRPIVVDEDNNILVGHGLYEAMLGLGYKTVAVYRVTGLQEKDKIRLMLADNKIGEIGNTNRDKLYELIESLGDTFDIPGYDEEELQKMFRAIDSSIEEYVKESDEAINKDADAFFAEENLTDPVIGKNKKLVQCPYCKKKFHV